MLKAVCVCIREEVEIIIYILSVPKNASYTIITTIYIQNERKREKEAGKGCYVYFRSKLL